MIKMENPAKKRLFKKKVNFIIKTKPLRGDEHIMSIR